MIRLKAIVIIFLTLFVSCTDDLPQPSPVPVSIEPNFMIQGEQSVVIIHGFDFFPSVHISHNNSSDSQLSSFFRLFLGGFELMNVNYIDTRTLAARVPAGIAVGSYDLIVIDPEGRIGILTNAFNVTITCAGDLDCQDICHSSGRCVKDHCVFDKSDKDSDGDSFVDDACPGGTDCDDDPLECGAGCYPGNIEICDGQDNDCNKKIPVEETDGDGDGYVQCLPWSGMDAAIVDGGDCQVSDSQIYPGATEICDGKDNDCDPLSDDGAEDPLLSTSCDGPDDDSCYDDTYTACTDGELVCSVGTDNMEGPVGDPTCSDGLDNDCDGWTDGTDSGCYQLSGWSFRRQLVFDNSDQDEDLIDFPVLVLLNSSRINYSSCQGGGEDVRFVDDNNETVIPHEIESWDASGSSYVWVKIPRINGSSVTDFIWMYYGNSGAMPGHNPEAVWSSGYQAVYHMHDNLNNSTSNAYHGVNMGTSGAQGIIGNGRAFDGLTQYIDLGTDLSILQNKGACTLSAWVATDSREKQHIIDISINNSSTPTDLSRGALFLDNLALGALGRSVDADSPYSSGLSAGTLASNVIWSYLIGVIDYTNQSITVYIIDTLTSRALSSTANFGRTVTPDTVSTNSAIGAACNGLDLFFEGNIDEVRIADQIRSADWIAAQYKSIADDQFIIFGAEDSGF